MSRCYSWDAIRRDPTPTRRQAASNTDRVSHNVSVGGIIVEVRAEYLSDASIELGVSHAIGLANTVC